MEQVVYVDVLLVTNYIVNLLLIMCVGKLSGRLKKRCRIVAAALCGAAASLTIFLPLMGLVPSILMKLAISSAIVLIAFPYVNAVVFLKQLFLFFAVSFSFAGAMLGIWMTLAPKGMTYYNGVVYFDISPFLLIAATIASYALISLSSRFMKGKTLTREIYKTTVMTNGSQVVLNGLVDTGNHLAEPFSNTPVAVCHAESFRGILHEDLINLALQGKIFGSDMYGFGIRIRMIPYSNVNGSGVMPAFKADLMTIETPSEKLRVEDVYIGLSSVKIGDEHYDCLLNPGLISVKIH